MIWLTRLDGSTMVVNVQMIEFVEAVPDTVVTLVSGKKLVVCESPDELVGRVIRFYREAGGMPRIRGSHTPAHIGKE